MAHRCFCDRCLAEITFFGRDRNRHLVKPVTTGGEYVDPCSSCYSAAQKLWNEFMAGAE